MELHVVGESLPDPLSLCAELTAQLPLLLPKLILGAY